MQSLTPCEYGLSRNVGLRNDLESVDGKVAVEDVDEFLALVFVGTDDGVHNLAEKRQKAVIGTTQKIETCIVIDPIVLPIDEMLAVHDNVARHVFSPIVVGRERLEIKDTRKKIGLAKATRPIHIHQTQLVEKVATRYLGDAIGISHVANIVFKTENQRY
jgi:hypothetical protein